jgi:hypothetical protein
MILRRPLAFALIPLSAVPLVAGFPLVAPSVEKRVQELRGQSTEQVGDRSEPTSPHVDRPRQPPRKLAAE